MAGILLGASLLMADNSCAASEVKRWMLNGYEIVLERTSLDEGMDRPPDRLLVLRDRREMARIEDAVVSAEGWIESALTESSPFPTPGTNVTGGDTPQIVVQTFSLGAHCCLAMYVVDLGPQVTVHEVPLGGNYPTWFRKGGEAGDWEAVGFDNNFAYWHSAFAFSSWPQLIYRFHEGRFELAADRMRRSPPTANELTRDGSAVAAAPWPEGEEGPKELLDKAIGLVYTGNMAAAVRFFDLAWKPGVAGREELKQELFSCQLRKSDHWPGVAALNGVPPDPPAEDCPD